jgi:hypothetical protein
VSGGFWEKVVEKANASARRALQLHSWKSLFTASYFILYIALCSTCFREHAGRSDEYFVEGAQASKQTRNSKYHKGQ